MEEEVGVASSGTFSPGCNIMSELFMEFNWAWREKVAFWLMEPIMELSRQEPRREQ